MTQTLTADEQLELLSSENAQVIKYRKELQAAIDQRNHRAYWLHTEQGVSLGQLAQTMGLTRSAVQGMFRALSEEPAL